MGSSSLHLRFLKQNSTSNNNLLQAEESNVGFAQNKLIRSDENAAESIHNTGKFDLRNNNKFDKSIKSAASSVRPDDEEENSDEVNLSYYFKFQP